MLPIAERELRVAARLPRTYRSRVAIAGIGVLIFGWMVWLLWWGRGRFSGSDLFQTLTWIAFLYCLFGGAVVTADSLSAEKRENTLGLLFLTDLKGYDIVLGKLLANSLDCFFGLLAMFPVLAIPLLMGGVQLAEFGRVVLSLSNTLFFSISWGLLVSALSKHSMRATSFVLLLMAFVAFGLSGLGELLRVHYQRPEWGRTLEMASPLFTQVQAFSSAGWGRANSFWPSLVTTHVTALVCLALACWILPRVWQERPGGKKAWGWRDRWRRWKFGATETHSSFRSRLLDFNPFYWLSARERTSAISLLLFMLGFAGLGLWVGWRVGPHFGGPAKPLGGFVFVWFWTTGLLHVILLFRIVTFAAHRFAEDRRSGALELLLSTPLSVGQILRGQWLALLRQMWGAVGAILLVHALFFWGVLELLAGEGQLPAKTGLELLKRVFEHGLGGKQGIDWHIIYMLMVGLSATVLLAVHWITLGWVGMWMGIKAKRPRNAPWATLALVLIPPWPIFILFIAALDYVSFFWTEYELLYLGLKVGFGLGLAHNLILSIWAWRRLRRDFRVAVTDRSEFSKRRWSWADRRRIGVRFALGAMALYGLVTVWRIEENWRGRRAWSRFQNEIAARGESLDPKSLAPAPAPVEQNFAAAPIIRPLFEPETGVPIGMPGRPAKQRTPLLSLNLDGQPRTWWGGHGERLGQWQQQRRTDLKVWQKHFRGQAQFPKSRETNDPVADVLLALSKFDSQLTEIREAGRRPYFQPPSRHAYERYPLRLHFSVFRSIGEVLQLRASAYLARGVPAEAMKDIRLIMRLADALGAEDLLEAQRVRGALLGSAIQVIWEGLSARRWSADQVMEIQKLVQPLNVLADYPKSMRLEILLQIAAWERFQLIISGERPEEYHPRERSLQWLRFFYPAGWIYYRQIEAYRLYQDLLLPLVDVAEGKVFLDKMPSVSAALERSEALMDNRGARHNFESAGWEFARLQTSLHQAALACALERYRISHGQYPQKLEALAPEYLHPLPRDVITGGLVEYRRTNDDEFTLSSQARTGDMRFGSLRWVWKYPAK